MIGANRCDACYDRYSYALYQSAEDARSVKRGSALPKSESRIVVGYSIVACVGVFPDRAALHEPTGKDSAYSLREIDKLLDRSALNYRDHREVLEDIPPRRKSGSLQVYFW